MLEKTYIVQDALCLNWSRTRERICNAMCCQSALQLNDTKCFPRKTDMSVGETIILVLAYYTWNITQFATERVGFLHLFFLFFFSELRSSLYDLAWQSPLPPLPNNLDTRRALTSQKYIVYYTD